MHNIYKAIEVSRFGNLEDALRQAWAEGKYSSKAALGKAFGISRQAVYRYLKQQDYSSF